MEFWRTFSKTVLLIIPLIALGVDRIDYSGVHYNQTPGTQLGLDYPDQFSGVEYSTDKYFFPAMIPLHHWGLYGAWNMDRTKLVSLEPHASIRFNFKAQKVFVDMESRTGSPLEVTLLLNNEVLADSAGKDAPTGMLIVTQRANYELIDQDSFKEGLLELHDRDPGLIVYGFSFN